MNTHFKIWDTKTQSYLTQLNKPVVVVCRTIERCKWYLSKRRFKDTESRFKFLSDEQRRSYWDDKISDGGRG